MFYSFFSLCLVDEVETSHHSRGPPIRNRRNSHQTSSMFPLLCFPLKNKQCASLHPHGRETSMQWKSFICCTTAVSSSCWHGAAARSEDGVTEASPGTSATAVSHKEFPTSQDSSAVGQRQLVGYSMWFGSKLSALSVKKTT